MAQTTASRRPGVPGRSTPDERRRLTTPELVGLAAGGTIGSGWLFAAGRVQALAAGDALWAWAIGGLLMLLVAVVMVELSMAAPSSGGLVVWPLRACGPLVAGTVAAAVWISYAINPAAQAATIVRGLARWWPRLDGLYDPSRVSAGTFLAVAVMAVIVVLTMLPPRMVIRASMVLAAYKIAVLVLIVGVLLTATVDHAQLRGLVEHAHVEVPTVAAQRPQLVPLLAALTNGAVVYAYIGFQAPLDFAGDVRRRGIGEANRMRLAVYGTVALSALLYGGLQLVYARLWPHGVPTTEQLDTSPYVLFAQAAGQEWLAVLVLVASFAAPLGSGLVFAYALTREVAALSRFHLVHRGLQAARRARLRAGPLRIDAYWLIPLVNLVIGALILALARGNWSLLSTLNSIPILVAYAVAGVALTSLAPDVFAGRRGTMLRWLSFGVFVAVGQVVLAGGWDHLWPALMTVAVGTVLILGMPWLAERDLPGANRLLWRYDARDHVGRLLAGTWRRAPKDHAVMPFLLLTAYAAVLLLCSALGHQALGDRRAGTWTTQVVALVVSAVAFRVLVTTSRTYRRAREAEPHGNGVGPTVSEGE